MPRGLKVALVLAGGIVGTLALAVLGVYLMGRSLPVEHRTSATLDLAAPPEQVFDVIADLAAQPTWFREVTRLEHVADRNGHETWHQYMGMTAFVLETTRRERPHLLERTIRDEKGPYTGDWTFDIAQAGAGSTVTLTERGKIDRPIPRFVMRYLVGEGLYARQYLASLAARLGEPSVRLR